MQVDTNILIFKTNIVSLKDKKRLAEFFKIQGITEWSVDMDDIDCVLRIVTARLSCNDIISQVASLGYYCEELN